MSSKLAFQAHEAMVREDCLRKQRQEESIGAGISVSKPQLLETMPRPERAAMLMKMSGTELLNTALSYEGSDVSVWKSIATAAAIRLAGQ